VQAERMIGPREASKLREHGAQVVEMGVRHSNERAQMHTRQRAELESARRIDEATAKKKRP